MLRVGLLAVVIGVIVGLLCVGLIGPLLVGLVAPPAVIVGSFLITWGWILGVLVALWFFLTRSSFTLP